MIDKIKGLIAKAIEAARDPHIRNIAVVGVFWEIILGAMCLLVTDNTLVTVLASFVLAVGCIAGFFILSGGCAYAVHKIVNKIKEVKKESIYTPKGEADRIKRIKANNKENEKIRIGFYCDGGQFWSTFCDVYEMMLKDDKFETVVVAAPETFKNEIYHYDAIKFLEEKKIPYIKAYDNGKWIKFKDLKIDYFFYNRHYLGRQSKHTCFNEARKYSKICYIPYAICPQVGQVQDTLCRFEELRGFDYLFSENKMMTRIYTKYKNKFDNVITKIETVGSPKFAYAVAHADKRACHDKKYVQSVLYTPRWCFNEGTSSFFELEDFFFDLVRNNKDIEYIFRPHPLMRQAVEEKLGAEFFDEFLAEFDNYENAYVDLNTDYMESFSKASVLVSDLSTMMFEFSVTEKPVIYMYKVNKLNEFGKEASKGYYYCYNADDVDKTLRLLREGKDKFDTIRAEISQKLYYNDGVAPCEQICNIIADDYKKIYGR